MLIYSMQHLFISSRVYIQQLMGHSSNNIAFLIYDYASRRQCTAIYLSVTVSYIRDDASAHMNDF